MVLGGRPNRTALKLTLANGACCEDGLFPLPETRVNALVDERFCEGPSVGLGALPLGNQLIPSLLQTFTIIV